jgi:IrrE N-terminal-like domain
VSVTSLSRKRRVRIPRSSDVPSLVAPLLDGILCPPTDLSAVAARLNAEITYEGTAGAGELRRSPNGWRIVCNPTLPMARGRFTIAHEIGHVLLANIGWEGKQEGNSVERFCDVVATELLMPARLFRQDLQQPFGLPLLRNLQERYGSSLQATAYRCAEIGGVTVVEARAGEVVRVRSPLGEFTGLSDQQLRKLMRQACDGVSGSARMYLRQDHFLRLWDVVHLPLQRRSHALLLINRAEE